MSNALKFTPRGGRITLSVSGLPDGGQLLLVKDTGPGIPREEIPRVMQAFGQGSLAHQTAEGGTGLGLPIVQNLVSLHGGTFELRSEMRKGTEAVVVFPKSRVFKAVPPLQPLGQERHKQSMPSILTGPAPPGKTKPQDAGNRIVEPSTAVG
jgi:two-component system cell cycle sensor histidine kinase PleC